MSNELQNKSTSTKKNTKKKAIAFIGLCVVACKLPFVLALIGFGGIGVTTSLLNFSPAVQNLGLAIGVLGVSVVISYWAYRIYRRSHA